MNNQEIIDNAPEGATHFDTEYGFYWMMDRERSQAFSHSANKFEWDTLSSDFLRSLEDIKRIAELEKANTLAVCSLKVGGKMNQILTAKVAELEKIGLELVLIIECHHDSAYCDEFDYEELKAAKEALKEKG